VYENGGQPARWYFTGKTGEVLKKRNADVQLISQRWKRIAAQSNSETIAIMRQQGGFLKFLGEEAWESFVQTKGVVDNSILSVHCFVKGNNKTIFRNSFELKDKLGRFSTSTHSYTYHSDNKGPEAITILNEKDCVFTESKASSLKNIMDLATHTIIRYLEVMLKVKVLSLTVDYVIDNKSQLWMLWTSDAAIVRVASYGDIQIPGFSTGDKAGRMSWAGPKYLEGEQDMEHRKQESPSRSKSRASTPGSPKRLSQSRGDSRAAESSTKRTSLMTMSRTIDVESVKDDFIGHQKLNLLPNEASKIISSASNVIDEAVDASITSKSRKVKMSELLDDQQAHAIEPLENNKYHESKFPDPFKCKGDFCRFRIQQVGPLHSESEVKQHSAEKLFTTKELETLRKNKQFNQMMDFTANGPALAAISNRSIVLARQEQRAGAPEAKSTDSWREYPTTPRERRSLKDHLDEMRANGSLPCIDGAEVTMDDLSVNSTEKRQLLKQQVCWLKNTLLMIDTLLMTVFISFLFLRFLCAHFKGKYYNT
jgi:hypothetical protein